MNVSAEIVTRPSLTEAECWQMWQWSLANHPLNNFDPTVLMYPRTVIAKATEDGEPVVFLPLHPVLMFESLAPKPGLSAGKTALAMRGIQDATDQIAQDAGYGEMYFLCGDEGLMKAASKRGWVVSLYDPVKLTYLMKRRVLTLQRA